MPSQMFASDGARALSCKAAIALGMASSKTRNIDIAFRAVIAEDPSLPRAVTAFVKVLYFFCDLKPKLHCPLPDLVWDGRISITPSIF